MFIDLHNHVSLASLNYVGSNAPIVSPEQLVAMQCEAGIDRGVLLPCLNPEAMHIVQSNEDVLRVCAQYPERFIPFCNIDPRQMFNHPGAPLGTVLEYYREQGCKGIGEVAANLSFDDPRMRNLFRHVEAVGFPLTFHIASREGGTYGIVDELGLPGLERALQDFPKLSFLGHSQCFWSHISGDVDATNWSSYPTGPVVPGGRVVELMRRYPTLHGDLSAGSGFTAVSRDPDFGYAFLEEFQDRVFFATDICLPTQAGTVLVWLKQFLEEGHAAGRISDTVFAKVTHRNAQRLLGLGG
ncbi:MAG: amidohydrolase family protein [Victivallales bacterium]|nr:amidohydrolase family protein [Victivallales bacterium]